jgi:hypothetical protein
MDPSQLRAEMTMPELVCIMVGEIQRIEGLPKATAEETQELADMRNNLGEFLAHINQEIEDNHG